MDASQSSTFFDSGNRIHGICPLECTLDQYGRAWPINRPKLRSLPESSDPDFLRPIAMGGVRSFDPVKDIICFTEQGEDHSFETGGQLPIRAYRQPDNTYIVYAWGRVPVDVANVRVARILMEGLATDRKYKEFWC